MRPGVPRGFDGLKPLWLLALVGCLALAACGSSASVPRRSVVSRTSRDDTAPASCVRAARLSPGVAFDSWRMGAVHFLSSTVGVGITATGFPCTSASGEASR